MKKKDERVRLISEIISGIKVLKLNAWEPSFEDRVGKIRKMELGIFRKTAHINALSICLWYTAAGLVSLASFATFVLMDDSNVLDAQKAFVSLTLFNILQRPMGLLPYIITDVVQVSMLSFGDDL
ncbi:unnamed protein product [Allacma fusca]|uniref:ABC transmembrane type-1 domain-containing protein n=1 Tax=Allacma fusca TaxID=39272 RepID=A0A8J2KD09_9HEXA|nr:unnamed protein product [Allacma fusca]